MDVEKKSSFGKHTRLSQQVGSSFSGLGTTVSNSTSSNNRLVAHKTSSISDFKKPVSLSSHPISLQKGHI